MIRIPAIPALALGTLSLLAACGGDAPAATPVDAPMFVGLENLIPARQETLLVGPAITGTLEADRAATVRAEVGGALIAALVEPGQSVGRGQELGRIDDAGLRDSYLSAQSAARTAEMNAGLARRNAEQIGRHV